MGLILSVLFSVFSAFGGNLGTAINKTAVVNLVEKDRNGFWKYYCGGAYIETSTLDSAPAYIVSNAHCYRFLDPSNIQRYVPLKNFHAQFTYGEMVVNLVELSYGSTNGTDLAVFKTDKTVGQLRALGFIGFKIAKQTPQPGIPMMRLQTDKETYSCALEQVGVRIKEGKYKWYDSFRYDCYSVHGASGSPLVNLETGEIFGVHNTSVPVGTAKCSDLSPCEVDKDGNFVSTPSGVGERYGQRVDVISRCFDDAGEFNNKLCGL